MKYLEILVFASNNTGGRCRDIGHELIIVENEMKILWGWTTECPTSVRCTYSPPIFFCPHQPPLPSHHLWFLQLIPCWALPESSLIFPLPKSVHTSSPYSPSLSAAFVCANCLLSQDLIISWLQGSRCLLFIIYLIFTTSGERFAFPPHFQFC